jgi:hypothetical protein
MRKIPIAALRSVADQRKSGYMEEILKSGNVYEYSVLINEEDYERIKKDFALPALSAEESVEEYKKSSLGADTKDGPSIFTMAKTANQAFKKWAESGFHLADEATLQSRIDACSKCEFWDKSGFQNTGRCTKCGCSTWAKLRMATEKCPIGKW